MTARCGRFSLSNAISALLAKVPLRIGVVVHEPLVACRARLVPASVSNDNASDPLPVDHQVAAPLNDCVGVHTPPDGCTNRKLGPL